MSDALKGLVSCVRNYVGEDSADYFLVMQEGSGIRTRRLKSSMVLNVGEFAEMSVKEGTVETFDALQSKQGLESLRKAMGETASRIPSGKRYRTGIDRIDEVTEKMWDRLSEAMLLLSRKIVAGAPITIRFHNDIDGASGAYALYRAIADAQSSNEEIAYDANIIWRMHGGVSYSREDATTDILTCNNYECVEKPLLVILDFGTSEESNQGIGLARERFDIVWLDHHPIVEKFEGTRLRHYINPWHFGGDSNYTAGFLSCMFAKTLADIDTKSIEGASFIGDYSEYSKPTRESRRLAALLDLLTSDTRIAASAKGTLTPEGIEKVIKDEKKSEELIAYAENRVAEMLDLAITSVKIYKAKDANIYVADFENIRGDEETRYPLPGRFASKLLGRLEELNKVPCVLFLHFGHFVSVRMSKEAIEKIALLKILEEVRKEYTKYVDSTGGHSNAASIKLKADEMKKEIINSAVDKIKKALEV